MANGRAIMGVYRRKGATLGLMPAIILLMIVIGMAVFYFAQFVGGNKELVNATDAGALATASNILAVGLTSDEVKNLPPEFQNLGVDNTGTPIGIDANTGSPDLTNAIFNVYAFNRAAGLTLLVALNAAEDGSPSAIYNANTLITALNNFGTKLNTDMQNSPSFANAFVNLATNNRVEMLGNSTISLGDNDQVQFANVPSDGSGKANVYFNSAIYQNDPTLKNWIQQMTSSSGATSQINSRYNASDPNAQAGQPFVCGYKALDMSTITGVPGFTPLIYTCAVNPGQLPHMIDQNRFNNLGASANCYAPSNSTLAKATATDNRSNLLCSALGCAMLGSSDNQYPIAMSYGWIRIKNNPDAIEANVSQSPAVVPVPLWINGIASIFNNELWMGAGGYGGINLANNSVFDTEGYDNPNDPFDVGPPGYSGVGELNGWVCYNNSNPTDPTLKDQYGHDKTLDPSRLQNSGNYILGYPSPTANVRMSGNFNQTATVNDMRGVTSVVAYCNSDMYIAGQTPQLCQDNLTTWTSNYRAPTTGPNGLSSGPYDNGTQPVGGLTNIEYLKGEVIGAYWDVIQQVHSGNNNPPGLTFTLNAPQLPSGSKVYDRSDQIAYAVPGSTHSVSFGTVGTPADLLNQLYTYNATCANVGDTTQWNDLTTPLGMLLQRAKQILPTVAGSDLTALLQTYPINLNQYQYIYLPIGGSKLTISQSPPAWLSPYPEHSKPGATIPDGTSVLTCKDASWDDSGTYIKGKTGIVPISVSNTVVNSIAGGVNGIYGDGYTHQQPYDSFAGNLNTYDSVTWTSNSGRNFFLGELSFGNYVNGSYGTYTQAN